MRYAQVEKGQKLHLVEEFSEGRFTSPLCGRKVDGYRMTINVPLNNACKNCIRLFNAGRHFAISVRRL